MSDLSSANERGKETSCRNVLQTWLIEERDTLGEEPDFEVEMSVSHSSWVEDGSSTMHTSLFGQELDPEASKENKITNANVCVSVWERERVCVRQGA